MTTTRTLVSGLAAAVVAAITVVAAPPADGATVTVDLCARQGTVTMPDATVVPIWGYAPGACAAGSPAVLPGPPLAAVEGDTLVVNLEVDPALPESVSLTVPNLDGRPDTAGVAPGGSTTYTFESLAAGTYLYESGANPSIQVPMGLHGVLVVQSADAGTVYGAGTGTDFDTESALVLSEIDTELNTLIDPNDFSLNTYAPDYFLINGAAYPDTAAISAAAGDAVLVRYVNAGSLNHSMRLLGLHQRVVGRESHRLAGTARDVVAEMLAAGQVAEAIVDVPAGAPPASRFALSSRNGRLTNSRLTGGGMLTFIETEPAPPAPPDLPLSFRVARHGRLGHVRGRGRDRTCGHLLARIRRLRRRARRQRGCRRPRDPPPRPVPAVVRPRRGHERARRWDRGRLRHRRVRRGRVLALLRRLRRRAHQQRRGRRRHRSRLERRGARVDGRRPLRPRRLESRAPRRGPPAPQPDQPRAGHGGDLDAVVRRLRRRPDAERRGHRRCRARRGRGPAAQHPGRVPRWLLSQGPTRTCSCAVPRSSVRPRRARTRRPSDSTATRRV